MEIVLGIDNIIFLAILTGKLPPARQAFTRALGLTLALFTRIALLCAVFWLIGLARPLFSVFNHAFSVKDLIMIGGGLFLILKATQEIHDKTEGPGSDSSRPAAAAKLPAVLAQIVLLDIVFSIDSIITAVGLSGNLPVMIAAITLAIGVMLFCSGIVSNYINRHPSLKMLAVSLLMLIGVMLVADGFGEHIPRGYIYFAVAFSMSVEMLQLRSRARRSR